MNIFHLLDIVYFKFLLAISETFKYPNVSALVEQERIKLESRAVENKEIINHTINVDDIRAKGF